MFYENATNIIGENYSDYFLKRRHNHPIADKLYSKIILGKEYKSEREYLDDVFKHGARVIEDEYRAVRDSGRQ